MSRFALGIEYDGGAFMGWQRQQHAGRTVQAELEAALSSVANHKIDVVCAGRTDAGVHASGQVVHFNTDAARTLRSWLLGLNSNLPEDVAVNWVHPVGDAFHARFSARARHYRYSILCRTTRPALVRAQACWTHRKLDAERMQQAAHSLLGEHDFSAFRAAECQAKSPVRKLHALSVQQEGEWIYLDAVANGFLHHMVRNLAGVLMAIGAGRREPGWAREVLEGRDRRLGGVTAPAAGLCLEAVLYPARFELPQPADAMFEGISDTL